MFRFNTVFSFIKQHRAECICFVLLAILACVGTFFHEITYDEAQSWQIAKTAPWKDIVFLIPMYEGHPPFWHLLLAGPAKLGISWHVVYALLGIPCLLASAGLLLFKAPFPRWVRCLLPFNFFLCYQYGIIVRPYCIMMLLIMLLAIYFPQKDKRPGLFVGLLTGLCMCHVFGIAIAGGITLAWLWEMRAARPWKTYIPSLFKDRRFYYMLGMLGLVIVTIGLILVPHNNEYFIPTRAAFLWRHAIYIFLAMPADAVLTNLNAQITTYVTFFSWKDLILTASVGALLWAVTLLFFPRKKILFLVLPYLCMGCVMLNYSSCHHVGLVLLLFIWYLWITLAEDAPITKWPALIKLLAQGLLSLMLIIPIAWNLRSFYNDYRTVTFDGDKMVEFLKKYNLTDEVIFSSWDTVLVPPKNGPSANHIEIVTSPYMQALALMLNVFLDHNIIANFNNGDPNIGYLKNRNLSEPQQREAIFEQWALKGLPMVTLNVPTLDVVFNSSEDFAHLYRIAFIGKTYRIWKFDRIRFPANIYLHETLWQKYGPQILADQGIDPSTLASHNNAAKAKHPEYTITIYR